MERISLVPLPSLSHLCCVSMSVCQCACMNVCRPVCRLRITLWSLHQHPSPLPLGCLCLASGKRSVCDQMPQLNKNQKQPHCFPCVLSIFLISLCLCESLIKPLGCVKIAPSVIVNNIQLISQRWKQHRFRVCFCVYVRCVCVCCLCLCQQVAISASLRSFSRDCFHTALPCSSAGTRPHLRDLRGF